MFGARIQSFWRRVSRRAEFERELAEELQFHVNARADDLIARYGLSREVALRRARIEFGAMEKFKEQSRESVGLRLVDEARSDVQYALRTFARNKGFAAAVIATLGLGIGANTAVFSVVDAVLVRQLPVPEPHELVMFQWLHTPDVMVAAYSGNGRPGPAPGVGVRSSFSLLTFERMREDSRGMATLFACSRLADLSFAADGPAESAFGYVVTPGYYETLGVRPAIGRTLLPADDRAGAQPVVVLSERFWRRRFGGDPGVLGRTVRINGVPVTIVGVSEKGFHGTNVVESVDLTLPMTVAPALSGTAPQPPFVWWVEIMGRLAPEVTPEQLAAKLRGTFAHTVRESWAVRPPAIARSGTRIPELLIVPAVRGTERGRLDAMPALAVLAVVVAAVLLIACVNVANLMLVRASTRTQEFSVRLVLGAGPRRIARQLLTESALLALGGAAAGVFLARWVQDLVAVIALGPPQERSIVNPAIDPRVLAFAVVLAAVTILVFGLGPALRIAGRDVMPPVKVGPYGGARARGVGRRILVGAQVALCLALVVGAGLFVRTLQNLAAVDLGFDPENLLTFRVDGKTVAFYEDLIARIEALPGVEAATASALPLVGGKALSESVRADDARRSGEAHLQIVRSNFFDAVGLPLLAGRGLTPADTDGRPAVAVINQAMALRIFGTSNPIGRRFAYLEGPKHDRPIEVVGLVRDATYSRMQEGAPPTFYLPYTQEPQRGMTVEVKTEGDPLALIPAVREAVRALDPDLPIRDVQTQRQQIARMLRTERSIAVATSVLGALALLLASIGLYGIVAYDVRRRTTEIGVRVALGAQRRHLLRLVLRDTLVTVAAGASLGIGLSLATMRLVGRMLFGVQPTDPPTMIIAMLVLLLVAAAATYLPARRAIRQDATHSLRYE